MSFTSDVKKEIIARCRAEKNGAMGNLASLSAFVRTSGEIGIVGGKPTFFLVSETENVAEYFMQIFSEAFSTELFITHATRDKKSGRDKLVLQCASAHTGRVLEGLRLLKSDKISVRESICKRLINTDEKKRAYIRGAFLGGGSCMLPTGANATSYHLEIVFFNKRTAQDFCDLLVEMELIAKLVERKETFVVYIKSKETISDFLALVGAENALKKFAAFLEKRDEANRDNRARNCMAGNADKSAIAAVKQVVAIRKIEEKTKGKDLSEELLTLAKARLKNPTASLKELAEQLGVSKSCINHRMRKLMEIAEELV